MQPGHRARSLHDERAASRHHSSSARPLAKSPIISTAARHHGYTGWRAGHASSLGPLRHFREDHRREYCACSATGYCHDQLHRRRVSSGRSIRCYIMPMAGLLVRCVLGDPSDVDALLLLLRQRFHHVCAMVWRISVLEVGRMHSHSNKPTRALALTTHIHLARRSIPQRSIPQTTHLHERDLALPAKSVPPTTAGSSSCATGSSSRTLRGVAAALFSGWRSRHG